MSSQPPPRSDALDQQRRMIAGEPLVFATPDTGRKGGE